MDFYVILGLQREASQSEVKRAYKRVARRYHPDINPGDSEAEAFFRQATEAYETLIDPGRREEYNANGVRREPSQPASVEFQGFDFSTTGAGIGASATFGELFSEVLQDAGEVRSAPDSERGSDLYGEISLSFKEAFEGAERRLIVKRRVICERCSGTGHRRTGIGRCDVCQGTGATRWRRGHMVFSKTCQACAGSGQLRYRTCGNCQAEGLVTRDEEIIIQIPSGISNGGRLRVESKGNAGRNGGEHGDLYITANVDAHRYFRREGDDLHMELPIAVHEAALGATVGVPTVDGPARIRVPPGSQSGERFRLRSRGMPSPRTGVRGDLIVEFTVVLPSNVDERSKELLREFGRIHNSDVRKDLFES